MHSKHNRLEISTMNVLTMLYKYLCKITNKLKIYAIKFYIYCQICQTFNVVGWIIFFVKHVGVAPHVLARWTCGALSFVVGRASLCLNGLYPLSLEKIPIMHLNYKRRMCLSFMCSAI